MPAMKCWKAFIRLACRIGIRMAEAEERMSTFTSDDIVTPMHFYSYGSSGSSTIHTKYHASMQLVVTGDVEDGYLDTSG